MGDSITCGPVRTRTLSQRFDEASVPSRIEGRHGRNENVRIEAGRYSIRNKRIGSAHLLCGLYSWHYDLRRFDQTEPSREQIGRPRIWHKVCARRHTHYTAATNSRLGRLSFRTCGSAGIAAKSKARAGRQWLARGAAFRSLRAEPAAESAAPILTRELSTKRGDQCCGKFRQVRQLAAMVGVA